MSHLTTLALEGESIPTISLRLSSLSDLHWLDLHGKIECSPTFEYDWPQRLSKLFLCFTHLDEDPLPSLGKLSGLRVLFLLNKSYRGRNMICPHSSFPELRTLQVEYLTQLEEWTLNDRGMPRLRNLTISRCKKLINLPPGLKSLASLEELVLSGMFTTLNASVDMENIRHVPFVTIDNVRIIKEESSQECKVTTNRLNPRTGSSHDRPVRGSYLKLRNRCQRGQYVDQSTTSVCETTQSTNVFRESTQSTATIT